MGKLIFLIPKTTDPQPLLRTLFQPVITATKEVYIVESVVITICTLNILKNATTPTPVQTVTLIAIVITHPVVIAGKMINKMEQKEIIEGKKLVAIYHGSMIIRNYDSSWNDITPVVEYILHSFTPRKGGFPYCYNILADTKLGTPIITVFRRVVDFIKWYNENK